MNILEKEEWIDISKKLFNHYKVHPNKLIIKNKSDDKNHNKAYYDLYNRTINLNLSEADNNKDLLISI